MVTLVWLLALLVIYPYGIYPVLLVFANRLAGRRLTAPAKASLPSVSVLLPVHNESGKLARKVHNLLALDYPAARLQLIVIGDGCTDDSLQVASQAGGGRVEVVALPVRSGKAAALNAGLALAHGEIILFTDAAIQLEPVALRRLVAHFSDPRIGCVSGEDYIEGGGNEGLYGRMELTLRREEARLHSIAGASGCLYAQRRSLCLPFVGGMAPDFLSVLVTVASGHRAVSEPAARGTMLATKSQRDEFGRKVRTFLRGITALAKNAGLLNPLRYPSFSFILWSHKLMRWLAPVFMLACLVLSWLQRDVTAMRVFFWLQAAAYAAALLGLLWPRLAERLAPVRLAAFFLLVNVAALKALLLWCMGSRVEIWQPTHRQA